MSHLLHTTIKTGTLRTIAALKKANQDKSDAMSFFMRTPFCFIKAQGAGISSYRFLHSQGGMGSDLFIRGRRHSRLQEMKLGSELESTNAQKTQQSSQQEQKHRGHPGDRCRPLRRVVGIGIFGIVDAITI